MKKPTDQPSVEQPSSHPYFVNQPLVNQVVAYQSAADQCVSWTNEIHKQTWVQIVAFFVVSLIGVFAGFLIRKRTKRTEALAEVKFRSGKVSDDVNEPPAESSAPPDSVTTGRNSEESVDNFYHKIGKRPRVTIAVDEGGYCIVNV